MACRILQTPSTDSSRLIPDTIAPPTGSSMTHTGPLHPPQHPYTSGLSEDEQYEAAVRASLNDRGEVVKMAS